MMFNSICRTILTPARHYIKPEQWCLSFQFTTLTSHSSNQHSFTVNYLINSCGFSPESAIFLASKGIDLSKSPKIADSVLALLNKQGFTKSQVSKVICKHPRILLSDPKKILLPNFQTLNSIGLTNTDLVTIVTALPTYILSTKIQKAALPCVDFLKTFLGSDDKAINTIKRFPMALTYDLQIYAAANIQMLLETGVPDTTIKTLLVKHPRTFLTSADRFRKVVRDVLEMGFDPSKLRFLYAIHACRAMSKSNWNKKVEVYKKWGWSQDEFVIAFERYPWCMMASMDKINKVFDFLVNMMGWESRFVVQWPIVTGFSLEKRVIPRCLVYRYLQEKGLIVEKHGFCFTKWLMYSDTKFLKWVLKRYEEEASEILKLYQKHLNETKGSTTSIFRNSDVVI